MLGHPGLGEGFVVKQQFVFIGPEDPKNPGV